MFYCLSAAWSVALAAALSRRPSCRRCCLCCCLCSRSRPHTVCCGPAEGAQAADGSAGAAGLQCTPSQRRLRRTLLLGDRRRNRFIFPAFHAGLWTTCVENIFTDARGEGSGGIRGHLRPLLLHFMFGSDLLVCTYNDFISNVS